MSQAESNGTHSFVQTAGGQGVPVAGACVLALLGLAGNYFSLPLFFGIDLVFGSIVTFVGIRLLGRRLGMLVAIPSALYTIVLWDQPYSAVILLCEAIFVALLATRFRYLALADAAFWLALGGPLLMALFWIFLGLPISVSGLVALKQFVNGILNASLASLILIGLPMFSKRRDVLFSELLFTILVLAILVPGVVLVSIDTRLSRLDLEDSIADKLQTTAAFAKSELRYAKAASVAGDQDATAQAALDRLPLEKDIGIRYVANNGHTIATIGNPDLSSLGTTLPGNGGLEIWLPERADAPTLIWWKRAKYVLRSDATDLMQGSALVTTAQAEPLIVRLQERNRRSFLILGGLTIVTILLAVLATHILSRPLQDLGLASSRLAEDVEKKTLVDIPDSWIRETNVLAEKFRNMACALVKSYSAIEKEKGVSDDLLHNILPREIAKEIKERGATAAKHFDAVTVLFTDFKGFTQIAEKLSPSELVAEIHTCFSEFDAIVTRHGLEKIKTIGDAYMCAGGIPVPNQSHARDAVSAALEIRDFMLRYQRSRAASGHDGFEIRIGIHTGPVIAGVVGKKKFAYDIWGDTVNTASRIESSGEAGCVNISAATYQRVRDDFHCVHRGQIAAKGKGLMDMYFVKSHSNQRTLFG